MWAAGGRGVVGEREATGTGGWYLNLTLSCQ